MLHDGVYVEGVGRIGITKHADKRVRQRMGLRRSAVPRTIRAAYERGMRIKGVDGIPTAYEGSDLRHYHGFVFVFAQSSQGIACVTVLREGAEIERSQEAQDRIEREQRKTRQRFYRKHAVSQRMRSRNIDNSRWRGW